MSTGQSRPERDRGSSGRPAPAARTRNPRAILIPGVLWRLRKRAGRGSPACSISSWRTRWNSGQSSPTLPPESPVGAPAPVRPELTAGIAAGAGVGMVNMLLGGRFAEIPFGAFAPRGRADQPQHPCSGPGRQVVAIPNEPSALGRGSARCDSGRQVSAVDLPAEGARRTEAVPGA